MEIFDLHPENPQKRLVQKVVDIFEKGGLIVYPTEAGYSVGCSSEDKKAIHRLYALKKPIKKYVMALMFNDFSKITEYALIDNFAYRYMKERQSGHYTFILPAQISIARKLDVKRKEVGVRMPRHPFLQEFFSMTQTPILNTAANITENTFFTNPEDLIEAFKGKVDAIVTCGEILINPTNVISLVDGYPEIIRGEE
jgi:tRNA threonylcarbamoyl adenosine modification protein (Sua5/YciO/YrdC/YwlC family)